MIPILYASTEKTFASNGLGGLPDAISCVVTEQRNNPNGYYLEMEYPSNGLHFSEITPDRIIYAVPSIGKTPQPFRIKKISRPIDGIVRIDAPHVSEGMNKIVTYGIHSGTNIQGMCYNFLYKARQLGQTVDFWLETDITTESSLTFSQPLPTSLMNVLIGSEGSVLDIVGGEFEFDKWHILLHRQRGVDSGLEIRYGVNMTDIEAQTDASGLITAVVPFYKKSDNNTETIVIGDMRSSQNAGAFSYLRCVSLDVTDQFESTPTKDQVTSVGQQFVDYAAADRLSLSVNVKFAPTVDVGERPIHLCDYVRIVYPDMDISTVSKVVETRFNVITERYEELTIGSVGWSIVDTIAESYRKNRK